MTKVGIVGIGHMGLGGVGDLAETAHSPWAEFQWTMDGKLDGSAPEAAPQRSQHHKHETEVRSH